MAKGKKIKAVDLSDKPGVLVVSTLEVKEKSITTIKHDYRGTQYVNKLRT